MVINKSYQALSFVIAISIHINNSFIQFNFDIISHFLTKLSSQGMILNFVLQIGSILSETVFLQFSFHNPHVL